MITTFRALIPFIGYRKAFLFAGVLILPTLVAVTVMATRSIWVGLAILVLAIVAQGMTAYRLRRLWPLTTELGGVAKGMEPTGTEAPDVDRLTQGALHRFMAGELDEAEYESELYRIFEQVSGAPPTLQEKTTLQKGIRFAVHQRRMLYGMPGGQRATATAVRRKKKR